MDSIDSATVADNILGKILEHQTEVLGSRPFDSVANAEAAAKQIAAFRKTLIEELKKQ